MAGSASLTVVAGRSVGIGSRLWGNGREEGARFDCGDQRYKWFMHNLNASN
jgi:hypothetical protein